MARCSGCKAEILYTSSQGGIYWSCQDCGKDTKEEV